jgi:tetratricopeptide (TPR) repeat protein
MRILILGGDGYLGWSTALYFSRRGHEVAIVDNFLRRRMHLERGTDSLTPFLSMHERVRVWQMLTGQSIASYVGDLQEWNFVERVFQEFQPETVIHYGEIPSAPLVDKPDAAATKAYKSAVKSLNKAHEYEEAMAKATNPDKKADELDKTGDAYGKALDYFTMAIMNKGDMVEAWNGAGYVHLRLGAYNESIDDYNHTLALKPELYEAIEHRAEAYMALDRLEDAKASYMNLFNHARPLADQLLVAMQKWLGTHRVAANGMRAADIDSFDKWLQERDGIAKQTASAATASP